ncbi:MAG: hypothetical protein ACRBBN_15350 [Methyloligellaceae bacterium]
MEIPAEYQFLIPVVAAALLVFFVDLLGNSISFGSKVINALVTAIIFGGVIYGLDAVSIIELDNIIQMEKITG